MKILVLTNFFPPEFLGGYEIGCQRLVAELNRRGHKVEVLTSGSGEFAEENLKVNRGLELADIYRHPAGLAEQVTAKAFNLANALLLRQRVRDGAFDLIYVFNIIGLGGLQIIDYLNVCGVPWVWHLMDNVPHTLTDGLPSEVLQYFECSATRCFKSNGTLVMSRSLRKELADQNVEFDSPVHIVPGWIEWRDGCSWPVPSVRRSSGQKRFVALGSLSTAKGTDLIIETAAALAAAREDFSIDLFGPGNLSKYRRKVRELSVESLVSIRGVLAPEEVKDKLAQYDAFLFPTWSREPFGFVALEAAMAGLVPIITSGAGVTEYLTEGKHFIPIQRTHASLKKAMLRIMHDPNVSAIAEACREKAICDLTLEKVGAQVEAILSDAARAGPRRRALSDSHVDSILNARQALLDRAVPSGRHRSSAAAIAQETVHMAAINQFQSWKNEFRSKGPLSYKYWLARLVLPLMRIPLVDIMSRIVALESRDR